MVSVEGRAPPSGMIDPVRSVAKKRLRVDWHDFLINTREPGKAYATNYVFRPPRALATGFQYKATTGGTSSGKPFEKIAWPTTLGGTIPDGSVTWTAEAIATTSLRATVSSDAWTADTGVTISDSSASDLVHTAYGIGWKNGQDHEVRHTITLSGSPGEAIPALIIVPCRD